jgi:signal transduction histidine kinase
VFEKLKLTEELAVNNFLKEVTFIQPTNSDVYLVTYVALSNIGAFGGLNKVDVNLMIILFFLLLIVALMLTKRKMNELEMIDEITILNKKLYADQEKLEESIAQLSRRNTQLKEFSQIISHNIRSPLAGLTLLIDFLHQDQMKLSEQEKKEVIEKLIFSAKTLNNLTDDLFETVSVLDSGELVFEEIDLLKALDKSKDVLTAQILQANASIEVDTNAWRNIKYNRQYLESIIFNLLSNALKYRDENRALVLKITTEIVEGKKVLKVSDNGRGINLEWHGENVFGLHKTFHRDSSGKGFGLFMTKTQIETLGGKIRVESEVGKGSTFIITF